MKRIVLSVCAAVAAAVVAQGETYTWKAGTSGDWETPGNWEPATGSAPGADDAVIIPGAAADYTVTVNRPFTNASIVVGSDVANTKVTLNIKHCEGNVITGDFHVLPGGTITHTALPNTATKPADECYKACFDVGGAFTLDAGAKIDVDSKGYAASRGPGYKSQNAGHGGSSREVDVPCYGSLMCPTNCGSGNNQGVGGGAVRVFAAGALTVNGTITAKGGSTAGWEAAAGGSVWLKGSTLLGNGIVSAAAGSGAGYLREPGGGRVAVHLTEATDFSAWHGSFDAAGGHDNSGNAGGAGTIYLQAAGQTRTNATVIVSNGTGFTTIAVTPFDEEFGTEFVGNLVTTGACIRVTAGTLPIYGGLCATGTTFENPLVTTLSFMGPAACRMGGSAELPNVTCTVPGKVFSFGTADGDCFTISDASHLTLKGEEGNPIMLAGDGGREWRMKLVGSVVQDIRCVNASGSNASDGATVMAYDSEEGALANVNWVMMGTPGSGETVTWGGSAGSDWYGVNNWSPTRVPLPTDLVRIPSGAPAYPVLQANASVIGGLTVEAGASLTLQGANLTVTGDVTNEGAMVFLGAERLTMLGNAAFAGGTVTPASSEFYFGGDAAQRADLSGVSLHRVTVRKTGGRLEFAGGVTVLDALDLRESGGTEFVFAAGETVTAAEAYFADGTLVSSEPGTKWYLNSPIVSAAGVTVSDSESVARTVFADVNSREGLPGSTVRWTFGSLSQRWTGAAKDGKWESAANWEPAVTPGPTSRVVVATAGTVTGSSFAQVQDLTVGDDAKATTLVIRGGLAVGDNLDVRNGATLCADKPIAVTNNVRVRTGAVLTHTAQPGGSNTYGIDLTLGGDFLLESGARVDLDAKGYAKSSGPGYNSQETGHGGSSANRLGLCHDSLLCPTNCGTSNSGPIGGGRMKVVAAGRVTLNGPISAVGQGVSGWEASSGGSVWITAGTLAGDATINVSGGNGGSNWPRSGGGGRVAFHQTVATDFSAWHGTVKAYGGMQAGSGKAAGAGTIYMQSAGQGPTNATVIVDNGGNPSAGYTEFSRATESDTVGTLIVTNGAALRIPDGETLSVYGSFLGRTGGDFTDSASGCVAFCGSSTARIEGSVTFPDVKCTVPGKTIVFGTDAADCLTVGDGQSANLLTLKGSEDNPIILLADESGGGARQWRMKLNPNVVTDIARVSVSNCDASAGLSVLAIDSNDLGGNKEWAFSETIVPGARINWTGAAADGKWSSSGNWRTETGVVRAPVLTDRIVIMDVEHPPVISAGTISLNSLEICSGASLTLDGCTLCVTNDLIVAGTLMALGTETLACSASVSLRGGVFVPGHSTFRLEGGAEQVVSLNEGQVFHRFEIRKPGGSVMFDEGFAAHVCDWLTENAVTVQFAAGATACAEEFLCRGRQGTAETTASLTLTGTGSWNIDVGTAGFFSGVSVKNSQATGLPCRADARSADASGNSGWSFSANAAEWTGAAGDTKWETAGNWYPSAVPDANTHVLIAPRSGEPGTVKVAVGGASAANLFMGATGCGGGEVSFSAAGPIAVAGDWFTGTNTAVTLNSPLFDNTVAGSAYFRSGTMLTHDQAEETCKFNLVAAGDVVLERGVTADVSLKGAKTGPGYYEMGSQKLSAHAGTSPEAFEMNLCYGSAFAPTNSGSGNQGSKPGGGVVKIHAGGELRLDGTITSDGGPVAGIEGSSGGSVWLVAARLTGGGNVRANGGDNGTRGGGGGRVAVWTTAANGLADWHGSLQARGGKTAGGAGTVYVQTAEGTRTLRMDNTGRESALTTGSCELFDGGYSPKFWRTVSVVATNKATLVLRTDLSLMDLDLQSADQKLYLRGHTLTIYSSKHKGGRKWAAPYADLVVEDGGKIVWKGGFALIVR